MSGPRPARGVVFSVDVAALDRELLNVPNHRLDAPMAGYARKIAIPGPNGAWVECFVASSPVMEPQLAAKFPEIRTYLVESLDQQFSGRLEFTPHGLTAMLRSPEGTWLVDPWQSADPRHVIAYWLHDLMDSGAFDCATREGPHGWGSPDQTILTPNVRGPGSTQVLRTVRLALACTGEWGAYQSTIQGHAPNVADPLAAMVVVVARANVVYEADLSVHFNLVANNDQVVFTNAATDPYPTTCDGTGGGDCSGGLLTVNISTLSSAIGNSNFDIGHLLTRIYGGVAYLSSVCGGNKGGGISGIPRGGDVDPLTALVVIHEMGHQFGANHTFSGTRGRCNGNVSLPYAYEAGSGSSPMAYPGGCPVGDAPPSDNVALFADPFFHHASLIAIKNFLATAACPVQSATSNHPPTISFVPSDQQIPPSTPFVLTAGASDPDGNPLTYSWEQFDNGVARPLSGAGSTDNGNGALFRVFPPVINPDRSFPQRSDVLSGVPTPGEQLPSVAGTTRHFRVLVRDNVPGAGASEVSAFVNLIVAPGASPFAVTAPTEDQFVAPGSGTVSWSVGNTNSAPISCSSVVIRLSTDDGATFPYDLGTFPNTGAATVTFPETAGSGRVRVEGAGRIFFAVSRRFDLHPPCPADLDDGSGAGIPEGGVDINDLLYFLAAFEAGSFHADLDDGGQTGTPDGGVDISDLLFFLIHFESGC